MIIEPFSRAQQFTAVVSMHIMVDFLSLFRLTVCHGDDSDNKNDICFHY